MVNKIKECVATKKDPNFKIIARSDAKSVEGIDKMIERQIDRILMNNIVENCKKNNDIHLF